MLLFTGFDKYYYITIKLMLVLCFLYIKLVSEVSLVND
jgi:hypothetical protein